MEVIFSSETSTDFQRTTLRYIPEDSTLHNHRCENLKSCISNESWNLKNICCISCYAICLHVLNWENA
jgi:hypothetical protein